MDFAWSKQQSELYDRTLAFARARLDNAGLVKREHDRRFSMEGFRQCGDHGLTGLSIPEAHGGMGLDALTTAYTIEAFGRGCLDMGLVFSVSAHLFACAMPIALNGSEQLKAAVLPRLASGAWIGANAITEAEAGSDAFALKTTAVRDGDAYMLDGAKTYVTNAPVANVMLVYASTNPDHGYLGVSAFVVERGTPGLIVGESFEKIGLVTSPVATVYLEGCRVPARNLVGAQGNGARIFASSMQWERGCLFAAYLGMMDRQLDDTIAFAKARRQGKRRISQYQAISHRIVDMRLRLDTAKLLLYRACWANDQGGDAELEVCLSKIAASEAAIQSSLDAIQIHGGNGIVREVGIERALRDAVPSTLFSGTSEVLRNLAAAKLGL
jgi:alkylation response protein AidB-like acyl-CoA dehydrogenase